MFVHDRVCALCVWSDSINQYFQLSRIAQKLIKYLLIWALKVYTHAQYNAHILVVRRTSHLPTINDENISLVRTTELQQVFIISQTVNFRWTSIFFAFTAFASVTAVVVVAARFFRYYYFILSRRAQSAQMLQSQ